MVCPPPPLAPRPLLAKPFSPYSIQKRPEPQICQKFVAAIVVGGSSQGVKNLKKLSKFVWKLRFFKFWQFFSNFWPPDWNPQKQSLGQILDKFGVRGVFECCKGKKVSQPFATDWARTKDQGSGPWCLRGESSCTSTHLESILPRLGVYHCLPFEFITCWAQVEKSKFAFRPICRLHFGPVSRDKQHFGAFFGKWRRFEGNKKSNKCTKFCCTFWGHFYYKTGPKWDV